MLSLPASACEGACTRPWSVSRHRHYVVLMIITCGPTQRRATCVAPFLHTLHHESSFVEYGVKTCTPRSPTQIQCTIYYLSNSILSRDGHHTHASS